MDTVTKLPTDNLYVFITLFGLVLCLGVCWSIKASFPVMMKNLELFTGYPEAEEEEKQYKKHCIDTVLIPLGVILLFGIIVSLSGMFLWYFQHQHYQDRLIVAEAERAEIQLEIERAQLEKLKAE